MTLRVAGKRLQSGELGSRIQCHALFGTCCRSHRELTLSYLGAHNRQYGGEQLTMIQQLALSVPHVDRIWEERVKPIDAGIWDF
jgi:hypothetical protein